MARVNVYTIEGDRFLYIDGELWMWDTPAMRREQAEIAAQAHGNVLVAGYGFGLCQRCLASNPRVAGVLTVELHREVVDVANAHDRGLFGRILIGDFFAHRAKPIWDTVIGDLWDVEPCCLPEYLKFRAVADAALRPGGVVLGWGIEFFEWLRSRG